jgi:arsenate reductase
MAEGWVNQLKAEVIEAYSAGLVPTRVDPLAIRAMAEVGVDISSYRSKSVLDLRGWEFDYVITLCDEARQSCPFFPAKTAIIHHKFDDPPTLAAGIEDEEEAMAPYRRVRDEIKAYIETLPQSLHEEA